MTLRRTLSTAIVPLLIALLLFSDIGMGLVGVAPDEESQVEGTLESAFAPAGNTFEGGGNAMMFVEDFAQLTADHYEAVGLADYYGGAVATGGRIGPAVWGDDLYRWGIENTRGDNPATWVHDGDSATMRFSDVDEDGNATYPAGVVATLVSPTVDLRDIEPLYDGALYVNAHTGAPGLFDSASPELRSAEATYQSALPDGQAEAFVQQASSAAALRLLHGYDFNVRGDAARDGAHVEVAVKNVDGSWSPWLDLLPTGQQLRVDNMTLRARVTDIPVPRTSTALPLPEGAPQAPTIITINGGNLYVEGVYRHEDPDPEGFVSETQAALFNNTGPDALANGVFNELINERINGTDANLVAPPWMYRGQVESSKQADNGPWTGFGGNSTGRLIESVFDLTPYAGHMVRFRFQAATADPTSDVEVWPGLGWVLSQAAVHAQGSPGVQVIDLVDPGNGIAVPLGSDVVPSVLLHNTGTSAVAVSAELRIQPGATGAASGVLGVGPTARTLLAFDDDLSGLTNGLPSGVYRAHATATPQSGTASVVDGAIEPLQGSGRDFHFVASNVTGWQAKEITIEREADSISSGRSVEQGERLIIGAWLENTGTVPLGLDLAGDDADVHPVLLDLSGRPVGEMVPLQASVHLPLSRGVVGSAGSADATRHVEWLWSGSGISQPLRLALHDEAAQPLLEDGWILVASTNPNPLDLTFKEGWYEGNGCARRTESDGIAGAFVCDDGAQATSTPVAMGALAFRDENGDAEVKDFLASVTYLGGPFNVSLQHWATDNVEGDPPEHADAGWTTVGNPLVLTEKTVKTAVTQKVLAGQASGWYRLLVEAAPDGRFVLDEGRIDVDGVPRLWTTFDVGVGPDWPRVLATGTTQLAWLNGDDGFVPDVSVPQARTGQYGAYIQDGSLRTYAKQDDVAGNNVLPGPARLDAPIGRVATDAILQVPGDITVAGAAPRLEFRHWVDTGGHAIARVQVAVVDEPTAGVSVSPPDEARSWTDLVVYHGTSPGKATTPVSVPLDDYVGRDIKVRFLLHHAPGSYAHADGSDVRAGHDTSRTPYGWMVEEVRLVALTPTGPAALYEAQPGFTDAILQGGSVEPEVLTQDFKPWENLPTADNPEPRIPEFRLRTCLDNSPRRSDAYADAAMIVTDPIDLSSASRPILTLAHSGKLGYYGGAQPDDQPVTQRAVVGLEYQVRLENGEWPLTWIRQHRDPVTVGYDVRSTDLRQPNGELPGFPFDTVVVPEAAKREPAQPSSQGKFRHHVHLDHWQNEFDLSSLAGDEIRLRLAAWPQQPAGAPLAEHDCKRLIDWTIHSMVITEAKHAIEAAVQDVRVVPDDLASILLNVADFQPGEADAVFAAGTVDVEVDVVNAGTLPFKAEVALDVAPATTGAARPSVRAIEATEDGERLTPRSSARVELLPGDPPTTVRFKMDASRVSSGDFVITALINTLAAVDTKPENNVLELKASSVPYRNVRLDAATSLVAPFVGPVEGDRRVTLVVTNDGNLPEDNLAVHAELVQVLGPEQYASYDPPVTRSWSELEVPSHGATQSLGWTLDSDFLADKLAVGGAYAVLASLDSPRSSLPIADHDLAALITVEHGDITVPFQVENLLYGTDFSARNTTSQAPHLIDPAANPHDSWRVTAMFEGEETPSNVGWELTDPARTVGGTPTTGPAWHVPSYTGVDDVEQILESPVLPAHVIAPDSRGILSLEYNRTGPRGDVIVETRQLIGGEWTEWEGAGDQRRERVAVILAPDFPRVESNKAPDFLTYGIADHPMPPFYELQAGLWKPVECQTADGNLCAWTAFPYFEDAGDDHWREALDETLGALADRYGAENVGLYSTINDDLQVGTDVDGLRRLDFTTELSSYSLPIRSVQMLGERLDTYGALLLFGDNVTSTFARESSLLLNAAHEPTQDQWESSVSGMNSRVKHSAVYYDPDPVIVEHHRQVEAILRAASSSGVSVVAAIGPATGTVARSGIAQGESVTMWQSPKTPSLVGPDYACTDMLEIDNNGKEKSVLTNSNVATQPKEPCWKQEGDSLIVNRDNLNNYKLWKPSVAQSLALQEIVQKGGAHFVARSVVVGGGLPTIEPASLVVSANRGVTLVTAPDADADTVAMWLDTIDDALAAVEPQLPAQPVTWSPAPAAVSVPIGGSMSNLESGDILFNGAPFQVRVRVVADSEQQGHDAVSITKLQLLGSPAAQDLGIRLVTPRHLETYAPGAQVDTVIEVTNRGLQQADAASLTVDVEQVTACGGRCPIKDEPPRVLHVPALAGGEQAILRVGDAVGQEPFYSGFFPNPAGQGRDDEARYLFTAVLSQQDEGWTFNDQASALAIGKEVVDVRVKSFRVSPALQDQEGMSEVNVAIEVENRGTQAQRAVVALEVTAARPISCRANGGQQVTACYPGTNQPVQPLPLGHVTPLVARDGTSVAHFSFDPGARQMPAGIYKVLATVEGRDSSNAIRTSVSEARWLHIIDETVAGDEGRAARFESLQDAPDLHGPNTFIPKDFTTMHVGERPAEASGGTPADGLAGTGQGPPNPHEGRYAQDATTVSEDGQYLSHGWRRNNESAFPGSLIDVPRDDGLGPFSFEWVRSGQASVPSGGATWSVNPDTQNTGGELTAEGNGYGDFGPDALIWDPVPFQHGGQMLTLASYERPTLTFASKFQASERTGYVVEMQVPTRSCTTVNNERSCSWSFTWGEDDRTWYTLAGDETNLDVGSGQEALRARAPFNFNAGGQDEDNQYRKPETCITTDEGTACQRNLGTNFLSGRHGLWGATSSGLPSNEGWQRLEYPLWPGLQTAGSGSTGAEPIYDDLGDYCREVMERDGNVWTPESALAPCQYARADPSNPSSPLISRPVRFRFVAASYGGDTGVSSWAIDDLAITGHDIRVLGADTIPLKMTDDDKRIIPIRVRNDGAVEDALRVTTTSELRFPVPDVHTGVALTEHAQPVDELLLRLQPGEARTVWVTVEVGLRTGFVNSPNIEIPFTVDIKSAFDPSLHVPILIEAAFDARSWADLEVRDFVLGVDKDSRPLSAPVSVPMPVTLVMRNAGQLPLGVSGETITVDLIEEHIDPATGEVTLRRHAVDSDGEPLSTTLEAPLMPYRQTGRDITVDAFEWTPTSQGLVRLLAVANVPDNLNLQLPENDFDNNVVDRLIAVGPVRLSDLRIQETWLETLDGHRVNSVIEGHVYRVGTRITNAGQADALSPTVEFRIGSADPFSIRTLETFPGQSDQTFMSSPWRAVRPSSGADSWHFSIDVGSDSASATLEEKNVVWRVPIAHYTLAVLDAPEGVEVRPGDQVIVPFNVTNLGNARATPDVRMAAATGLAVHLQHPPSLLPGETQSLKLVITAGRALAQDADLPAITVTTREDDLVQVPLPIDLQVGAGAVASTVSASGIDALETRPGDHAISAVVDNQDNQKLVWSLVGVDGPLAIVDSTWSVTTDPFTRNVLELPVAIADHTAPGSHGARVDFVAKGKGVERLVNTTVLVDVVRTPAGSASVEDPALQVVMGTPAETTLIFANDGNVPLVFRHSHSVDEGRLQAIAEDVSVAPGQEGRIVVRTQGADTERVLGLSRVEWRPVDRPDGPWQELVPLSWSVEQTPAALRIVASDLTEGGIRAGGEHRVSALIQNSGRAEVEAEAILVVDGIVHDAVTISVKRLQQVEVELGFSSGGAGAVHQVQLLVRPAGSGLTLQDPAFHQVADATSGRLTVEEDQGIPMPGAFLVLAMLGVATWGRRRSRRS